MTPSPDFEPLARVDDIPEDGLLGVRKATGERICLVRSGGRILALSDVCSHQDFPLSEGNLLPGGEVECVWHGARFDVRTGAACHPPAVESVPVYAVRIDGDRVLVGPREL